MWLCMFFRPPSNSVHQLLVLLQTRRARHCLRVPPLIFTFSDDLDRDVVKIDRECLLHASHAQRRHARCARTVFMNFAFAKRGLRRTKKTRNTYPLPRLKNIDKNALQQQTRKHRKYTRKKKNNTCEHSTTYRHFLAMLALAHVHCNSMLINSNEAIFVEIKQCSSYARKHLAFPNTNQFVNHTIYEP